MSLCSGPVLRSASLCIPFDGSSAPASFAPRLKASSQKVRCWGVGLACGACGVWKSVDHLDLPSIEPWTSYIVR